jgi:glycosyltransferase involved in cell wall biosynthesis
MKILHIIPSFGFGGMERIICTIINSTAYEYDHELLSMDGDKSAVQWIKEREVTCVEFYKPNTRKAFFQALYRAIKKRNPHLLMTYNWGSTDAIWLGKMAGIKKHIHSEHGFNVEEATSLSWKRALVRFLVYRMTSKTVVVSNELLGILKQTFHLQDNRIAFIPNGINTTYYTQNLCDRERVRGELCFKSTDFVVGFSGRLDPIKNFDLMVKIFASCLKHDPDFKFLIIGDGPEKAHIKTLCKNAGIQRHVLLVGRKDNVLPYLRSLDAFLLTSHREQMPMTILEAMSVGIPVVASTVGEIPRIIDHGIDGFLASPHAEPETYAAILVSIKNEARHKGVGVRAREKIVSQFQEDLMISRYKNVLEHVIYS